MNHLSPAAQAMVEAHRRGEPLSRAARDRIKRGVLLRVATIGAATVTTGTALGLSLVSKIAVLGLAVALVGGGASYFVALRGRAPTHGVLAQRWSPPMQPNVSPSPPTAAQQDSLGPAESQTMEPGRLDGAKKAGKRHVAASGSASGSASARPLAPPDPGPELRVLRQAREDLRAGHPESAYQRLDGYDRQHGEGVLTQERQALLAIALCEWRPGREARARAMEFLRNSPESPLADRVRSACQKSTGAAQQDE